MKMSGERVIPAPQARVWEALNDPEVLRQSIPGCTEMVKRSPTEFSAKVMAKVGPVKANFAGDVTLSKLDPPNGYVISGKGTGGAAGFAEGGAEVRLEDAGGQTRMSYDVDAKVGGKLAQVGSRLIDSTARRMADDFFKRFAEVVSGGEPESAPAAAPAPAAAAGAAEATGADEAKPAATKAPAAKKAAAKKPTARKAATKKAAAKKPAARKASAPEPTGETAEPTAAPEAARSPSVLPEAAVATSGAPREAPRQTPPPAAGGNTMWWLIGAGIAALLIILVLANI